MMTTNYQKNNKILYLLFANISARILRSGDGIAVFSWYQVYDEKYIFLVNADKTFFNTLWFIRAYKKSTLDT